MNRRSPHIYGLLAIVLSAMAMASAQQLPPAEPAQPMPGARTSSPTLRVTTNEVLVPTLVEKSMAAAFCMG